MTVEITLNNDKIARSLRLSKERFTSQCTSYSSWQETVNRKLAGI